MAFQIVIERTGEKLTNVQVTPAALAGPNGAGISLDNLELFREWYVPVQDTPLGRVIRSVRVGIPMACSPAFTGAATSIRIPT